MGKVNECPYCGELRDEDNKCCYNWGQCLKLDKLFIHPVARETANQSPISADTTSINEMEEEKMGKKIARTTCVVKNIKTGAVYTTVTEQQPRRKEPGYYPYAKINPIGTALLQARGLVDETANQRKFDDYLCGLLSLPKEAIGSIGRINPDTGKGADEWEVTLGDAVIFPVGTVSPIVNAVAEPSIAQSDTTSVEEPTEAFDTAGALVKIKEYKAQGMSEATMLEGLKKKVTEAVAKDLIEQALRPKPKVEVKKELF